MDKNNFYKFAALVIGIIFFCLIALVATTSAISLDDIKKDTNPIYNTYVNNTFVNNTYNNATVNLTDYAYLPGRPGGQTLLGCLTFKQQGVTGIELQNNLDDSKLMFYYSPPANRFSISSSYGTSGNYKQLGFFTNDSLRQLITYDSVQIKDKFRVLHSDTTGYEFNVSSDDIRFGLNYLSAGDVWYSNIFTAAWQGRLGINTLAPTKTFQVGTFFYVDNIAKNVSIGTSSPTAQFDTTGSIRFRNCSGTPTMDAGGNMTCVSDSSMKSNIQSSYVGLAELKQLTPKSWTWNAASGFSQKEKNIGFVAQDVKAIIPDAVIARDDVTYVQDVVKGKNGEEDTTETREVKTGTQTLSINQGAIVAALVNAVKELDGNNTAQQTRINDLEVRLKKLEGAKL